MNNSKSTGERTVQTARPASMAVKKGIIALVIICLLSIILILSACKPDDTIGAFTDDSGAEIALKAAPEKIISLVPAITELIFGLDEGDRIVAVSDYCDYPADKLTDLPRFGFGADLSVEALIAYDCDALILTKMAHDKDHAATLSAAGITVIVLEAQSIADIKRHITVLGDIFNKEEKAQDMIDEMQSGLDAVAAAVAAKAEVTAYLEISPIEATLFTMNGSTFLGEILQLCKVTNVFADENSAWAMISEEAVIDKNPEFIIKMYTAEEYSYIGDVGDIASRAGWDTIKAVKDGNIIQVDSILYSRATNRVVQTAQDIMLKIHGVNMSQAAAA